MKNLLFSALFILINWVVTAQEKQKEPAVQLNTGADIVSSYVWRGTDFGASPAVQPFLSAVSGNFELGCWSSVATNSFYREYDLYLKYSSKYFNLIFTDYYVPTVNGAPAAPDIRYFVYSDEETAHTFEGMLQLKGPEKFPVTLSAGTFFMGNDKRWGYDIEKDSLQENYYSTYIEALYPVSCKGQNFDLFLGFTPSAGAYGNDAGIINAGITAYRKIKITSDFELPVKSSLIFNPQAQNVFFVFGITL